MSGKPAGQKPGALDSSQALVGLAKAQMHGMLRDAGRMLRDAGHTEGCGAHAEGCRTC